MLNMFYSTSKFRGVPGPCLRFTNTNVFLKSFFTSPRHGDSSAFKRDI